MLRDVNGHDKETQCLVGSSMSGYSVSILEEHVRLTRTLGAWVTSLIIPTEFILVTFIQLSCCDSDVIVMFILIGLIIYKLCRLFLHFSQVSCHGSECLLHGETQNFSCHFYFAVP